LIKLDGSSVFRIKKPLREPWERRANRATPPLILRLLRWQLLFVVGHFLPQRPATCDLNYKMQNCSALKEGTLSFSNKRDWLVPRS
jgi:hypothetical protein